MQIKIRKTDSLFSLYIRSRDKWTCKRCHKKYEIGSQGLHNSHFWGRGRESTRFNEENCDAICHGCHQYFHAFPNEYVEWKQKQLGEKRFNILKLEAHRYKKRDDKMQFIICKELLNR